MEIIEKSLNLAIQRGAEFVDVRLFKGKETRIYTENLTSRMGEAIIHDINLRVFIKGNWGVCSSSDSALLPTMAENAVKMANTKEDNQFPLIEHPFSKDKIYVNARIRPDKVDINEKLDYINSLQEKMRTSHIKKTSIFYKDATGTKSIYNSKGAAIEEEIMHTCLTATAVAKKGDRIESATTRRYATGGYEHIKKTKDLPSLAVQRALDLLKAKQTKQGKYTAVFDPLLTGTLIHEILGHCAEADLILQKNSILRNKLGSSVAPEDISVWDDPTIPLAPVHYYYDDEGVAAKKKPIILNGVLAANLHSLDSASKIKNAYPGNARCEDYSCSPLVRMSNTYVAGEGSDLGRNGLILKGTLGGEVEPGSGQFFIRPEIGELQENGEVKERIKDIIVVGTILDTLQSIEGVGNDLHIDSGTCQKEGQTIIIGSGGTSLKILNVAVVGG